MKPIEQHGFTLVDFTSDKMVLRFFKWDAKTQPVEALDALQPFPHRRIGPANMMWVSAPVEPAG